VRYTPHTLSNSLNPLDASGRLSRLMAASSPGAFIAAQMARRLRSAILSPSPAIQSVSRAAPRRRSISRCWLRASAVESAGRVKADMRGSYYIEKPKKGGMIWGDCLIFAAI